MKLMTPTRVLLAFILALSAALATSCGDEEQAFEYQSFKVRSGDLRVYIRQKGEIESKDPVAVTNPIPGRPTLLDIVPEGTIVKKGDRLFELDVNDASDKLLQQQISTSNAEQAHFKAEQDLEIQIQQNESDVKQAELKVLFAELDQKQYLQGDLPAEQEDFDGKIKLAEENLKIAKDKLVWSKKLAEKGYISGDALESDELAVTRQDIEVSLAKRRKNVLDEFTAKKRREELRSNLEEAKRELKRVLAKTSASLAQKKNEVKAKQAQWDLEKTKLAKVERQVSNNVVYSPADGIIVYAREGRRESKPIEEGATLREGQVVCKIPDMSEVKVDVDVHESWVQKVAVGMPVIITTDTGAMIQGQIESIASVPDSQSWYRNPDLKVYSTSVTVENPGGMLRPGMNCSAEIVLKQLEQVTQVPVQAVYGNGRENFCYVKLADGTPELRKVEVGDHNGEMIHVASGLKVSDEVYLALPPDAPTIPLAKPVETKVTANLKPKPKGAAGGKGNEKSEAGRKTGGNGSGHGGKPSADQMKKWREKMKNMSPEERKKAMERFGGGRGGSGGSGSGRGRGRPSRDS